MKKSPMNLKLRKYIQIKTLYAHVFRLQRIVHLPSCLFEFYNYVLISFFWFDVNGASAENQVQNSWDSRGGRREIKRIKLWKL